MAEFLRLTAPEPTLQMVLAKSCSLGTHMAPWWNRGHMGRQGWGYQNRGHRKGVRKEGSTLRRPLEGGLQEACGLG